MQFDVVLVQLYHILVYFITFLSHVSKNCCIFAPDKY